MTTTLRSFSLATLAAALLGLTVAGVCVGAWAQEPPTQEPEASAPSEPPPPPDAADETDTVQRRADERDEDVANVRIGSKVHLGAGETADTVVSMFASVTSEGRAQDIIAIFGNARVTGPVEGSVTAVFGEPTSTAKWRAMPSSSLAISSLGPMPTSAVMCRRSAARSSDIRTP
jgi:hypothetical protein